MPGIHVYFAQRPVAGWLQFSSSVSNDPCVSQRGYY